MVKKKSRHNFQDDVLKLLVLINSQFDISFKIKSDRERSFKFIIDT